MVGTDIQQCSSLKGEAAKLMAQYPVHLPGQKGAVGVRRGMAVLSAEMNEVGKVAAVIVETASQNALCLILSHLPQKEYYQSLPVSWIKWVDGQTVILTVCSNEIQGLPGWHPE